MTALIYGIGSAGVAPFMAELEPSCTLSVYVDFLHVVLSPLLLGFSSVLYAFCSGRQLLPRLWLRDHLHLLLPS
jgi:hypothetical protein